MSGDGKINAEEVLQMLMSSQHAAEESEAAVGNILRKLDQVRGSVLLYCFNCVLPLHYVGAVRPAAILQRRHDSPALPGALPRCTSLTRMPCHRRRFQSPPLITHTLASTGFTTRRTAMAR